eukprot:CAMPEP_0204322744 /NCGR_PEP_ID=MMETSP0469-20131031/8860_1 /ASSEMBLY_ACC=CAM_ASM_000384 /TAXON_ID=2969 /ORGANISM="Oxyrrhis marina" /LENGTH=85 /DNA_ID=CAMNT_0051304107 /DNA_START=56 /DNA_END=310 /DNA_ORIENTATION=-
MKLDFVDADDQPQRVKMLKVNCVDYEATCREVGINAYPSVRLYTRHLKFDAYQGPRTIDAIQEFLKQKVRVSHHIVTRHHDIFSE